VRFCEQVHTFDIDFAGHVSNIVYVRWMEIGRLKLLEAAGLPVERIVSDLGLLPTLIETKIRYLKQLFLGDTVTVELYLSRLKHVSAIIEFRFYNQKTVLVAEGSQTGLFIDAKTHRPIPLSRAVHQQFVRFLAPE
jgi:acyl-CoA thioester hydrolase